MIRPLSGCLGLGHVLCTYSSLIGRLDLSSVYYCLFVVVFFESGLSFFPGVFMWSFLSSPSLSLSSCALVISWYNIRVLKIQSRVCVVVWRGPGGEVFPQHS